MIITVTYLRKAFDSRKIDQLANDGTGVDTSIIQQAIASADAELKSRLANQYSAEQLEADENMKYIAAVFAMYKLEARRLNVTPKVMELYVAADKAVTDLVAGISRLSAVNQLLPRIQGGNSEDVFKHSGFFNGYPDIGGDL